MQLTETKFEAFVLRGLFAACLLVSGLILTAMLAPRSAPVQLAVGSAVHTLFAAAPSSCALSDVVNIVCIRAES
jgi:hypothetical protein